MEGIYGCLILAPALFAGRMPRQRYVKIGSVRKLPGEAFVGKTHYHFDLIFANLFFGADFSFYVSLTRNWLDFEQIFMLQVLSAALFFIPFALFSRGAFRLGWRDAGKILLVSLLVVYGWMYLLLKGASVTSPIDASVIATLGPAITLLLDHLLHPHRYLPGRAVGIVISLLGAGILLFNQGFELTRGSQAEGNLFVLLAVVAIAANTVLIKPQLERHGTLVVMGWYYIIGLAVTAPFFWRYVDHTDFLRLPLGAQAELAYILVLGTVLPMYLLYRGTEKLTAVHTALYRYIQPLAAGVLAVTRGQAHFNAVNLTAAGCIFTGVILVAVGYHYSLHHPRRRHARRDSSAEVPSSGSAAAIASPSSTLTSSLSSGSPLAAPGSSFSPLRHPDLPPLRSDGRLPLYSAVRCSRHSSGTGCEH